MKLFSKSRTQVFAASNLLPDNTGGDALLSVWAGDGGPWYILKEQRFGYGERTPLYGTGNAVYGRR